MIDPETIARVRAAIAVRKARYEVKRDEADILDADTLTRHEMLTHTVEAMEWLDAEVANMLAEIEP